MRFLPARSKCCPYSPAIAPPVDTAYFSRWHRTPAVTVGNEVNDGVDCTSKRLVGLKENNKLGILQRYCTQIRIHYCDMAQIVVASTHHLFLHAVLMVAVRQIEANSVSEVEVYLIYETVPFPELAQGLLFLVLRARNQTEE